jgi:hypothetical protein
MYADAVWTSCRWRDTPAPTSHVLIFYVSNNVGDALCIVIKLLNWWAGVAQSIPCLTTDWSTRIWSLAEAKDFSSSLCVQTSSEAHPASYPMGTGGSFSESKERPGRDADHSHHLVLRSRMRTNYTSCSPWHLHGSSGTALHSNRSLKKGQILLS